MHAYRALLVSGNATWHDPCPAENDLTGKNTPPLVPEPTRFQGTTPSPRSLGTEFVWRTRLFLTPKACPSVASWVTRLRLQLAVPGHAAERADRTRTRIMATRTL